MMDYATHVTASRHQAIARARDLGARLRTSGDGIAFSVGFLGLRKGPLQAIPQWLRISAELVESRSPTTAAELRSEAMTELHHQGELERDLVELAARDTTLESSRRHALALARHMRLRRLVPGTSDPFVVLALDAEFAALDVELCPALLDGLTYAMPRTFDARRFLRARSLDAPRRLEDSQLRLTRALRREPGKAAAWARVGADLVHSYLDLIEAYGPAQARPLAA